MCTLVLNACKDDTEKYYKNGILRKEYEILNGVRDGFYKEYNENGNMDVFLTYRNGKKEGPFIFYYANGKPRIKGFYKNNLQHGLISEHDSLGNLIGVGFKENGYLNGDYKKFYPNGKLKEIQRIHRDTIVQITSFNEKSDTTSNTYYAYVIGKDSIRLGEKFEGSLRYYKIDNYEDSVMSLYIVPQKVYQDYLAGRLDRMIGRTIKTEGKTEFTYIPLEKGVFRIWGSLVFTSPGKKRLAAAFDKNFVVTD